MILRTVPPAEEEVDDPKYCFYKVDSSKSINMQLSYTVSFMLDT